MVPSPTNYVVAQQTTNEFVMRVPTLFGLKKFAKRLTICALDERVRKAMLYVLIPFICVSSFNSQSARNPNPGTCTPS